MRYYGYEEFVDDVKRLVKRTEEYHSDTIVAIARGGWTLGHAYASATENRRLMSVNSVLYEGEKKGEACTIFNLPNLENSRKILLLDDIVDSGETMREVLFRFKEKYPHITIKTASIYYKKSALIEPDFWLREAKEWIDFFWEKDYLLS